MKPYYQIMCDVFPSFTGLNRFRIGIKYLVGKTWLYRGGAFEKYLEAKEFVTKFKKEWDDELMTYNYLD